MDEKFTRKMHARHNINSNDGIIDEGAFNAWWRKAEDQLTLIPDIVKKSGII
jgi:hypothetical protein